jgi:hypothetical protein
VGDIITGVYIYDSSTPDSFPDPGYRRGLYEHGAAPAGITLMVGGLVFMTDPENVEFSITVDNDFCTVADCHDALLIESGNNLPLPNGFPVNNISLVLVDSSVSALSSDELPTTAPVIGDWETGFVDIWASRARQYGFEIYGNLTSAVLIPEPTTIWLLVLGSLAIVRKRRG